MQTLLVLLKPVWSGGHNDYESRYGPYEGFYSGHLLFSGWTMILNTHRRCLEVTTRDISRIEIPAMRDRRYAPRSGTCCPVVTPPRSRCAGHTAAGTCDRTQRPRSGDDGRAALALAVDQDDADVEPASVATSATRWRNRCRTPLQMSYAASLLISQNEDVEGDPQ